jgi:hypothetical protein
MRCKIVGLLDSEDEDMTIVRNVCKNLPHKRLRILEARQLIYDFNCLYRRKYKSKFYFLAQKRLFDSNVGASFFPSRISTRAHYQQ